MKKASVRIEKGSIISDEFSDIYFDSENGLEESRYVFLEKNFLPEILRKKKKFTIAETGFGTGLNFLVLLYEMEKARIQTPLTYYSVEKYPVNPGDLKNIFALFNKFPYSDFLIENYPQKDGMHCIDFGQSVKLKLYIGDVRNFLPEIDEEIDCWFLDGFAPDKNPDMWCVDLFEAMGNITIKEGTFTSFTAAGVVKQGLRDNGFFVKRHKGFGKKRHMIAGYRK